MRTEIAVINGFSVVSGDEPPREWGWREKVSAQLPSKFEVEWDEELEEVTVRELLS